jgi:hypothetical protein
MRSTEGGAFILPSVGRLPRRHCSVGHSPLSIARFAYQASAISTLADRAPKRHQSAIALL